VIPARYPISRGFALLLVLAALVVVCAALAGIANLAATAAGSKRQVVFAEISEDLLVSSSIASRRWLLERSSLVLMPADVGGGSPGIPVFSSEWSMPQGDGAVRCRLDVTAWDQCAGVPMELLAESGVNPVGGLIPQSVRDALVATRHLQMSPGLDLFLVNGAAGLLNADVFPEARRSRSSRASLGGWGGVATHNPPPVDAASEGHLRSGQRRYRVNLCTAPLSIVREAMRGVRSGGAAAYSRVLNARRRGERPALLLSVEPPNPSEVDHGGRSDASGTLVPEFATTSTCWSMRVDVQVGAFRRSWWEVYRQTGSDWECVQRLAINE